jgi:trk system potassium uptake protein
MINRLGVVLRIIGIFTMLFSLSMLPPIFVSMYYNDRALGVFLESFGICLASGAFLWAVFYRCKQELKTRDGFLIVTLFWVVLSFFGAIPFMMDLAEPLSFTQAFFVAVSGLTTTGASLMTHLSTLPHSILYYRMQLHFLGGMGIVVLAVAVLPMLGIGGLQLAKAETAGPVKTTKLKPRMTQTAKALWSIYVGLVVLCALSYWAAGMTLFDAIGESYSTIATGGFSIHDNSFAYYHSHLIDMISVVFMILGASNFALHFKFLQTKSFRPYWKDSEFKNYCALILGVTVIVAVTLNLSGMFTHAKNSIVQALFTITSVATTTGFTDVHFNYWPTFLPYLVMLVALIGGCASSTAGGLKVVRLEVIIAQIKRELYLLAHPRAVVPLKLGKKTVSENIVQAVWGFVGVYAAVFIVLLLVLLAMNLDFRTAFGALAACLSNTGAGIGAVTNGFQVLTDPEQWVLIIAMLLGRLEIFTILVLFMPTYWRK